jgi:hypothetical protein
LARLNSTLANEFSRLTFTRSTAVAAPQSAPPTVMWPEKPRTIRTSSVSGATEAAAMCVEGSRLQVTAPMAGRAARS